MESASPVEAVEDQGCMTPQLSAPVPARARILLRAVIALLLAGAAWPAAAATISGFVRASENGEPLPYASVTVPSLKRGTFTNQSGFYVLAGLPAGSYTATLSCMGYRPESRSLTLAQEQELTLSLELQTAPVQLDVVEVRPGRSELSIEPSKMTLQTRQLTSLPSIAEADLFRAVQSLPGVSTLSDFSAGLYVRGGSPDQNLILLDDIDVYNPNHLFGFFSTFNVDAVKTVDLQKSGFPAQYGGRLSSLLDVHNREGNRKRLAGVARTGFIASSATLEGPWPRGSWMLSGRQTHIAALARAAKIDLPYGFYDVQGRVNYDVAANDRTSLSYYSGRDRLDWNQPGLNLLLDWGNETWSSQWTHVVNPQLFSHFVLGHSRFDSRAIIAFEDFGFRMKNSIDDLSLKGNLSWTPAAAHKIDFGSEMKSLDFRFRSEVGDASQLAFNYQGVYGALYAQDAWKLSEVWRLQTGLRLDYYSRGRYLRLGPRLSVEREIDPKARIHLTWGRYSQFLNLVSQKGASFADMWFPVDRTLQPGGADHYVLGADFGPYDAFDLSVEAYYKPYRNVVEFSEEFSRSLIDPNSTMSQLFNSGTGRAFGGEVFLRNRWRGWDGWLGYTFGVADRTIQGYNFGREYHPDYDRRHQVVVAQNRPLSRHWQTSLTFHYGSGQPLTLPVGRYTFRDISGREYDTVLEGEKNASRLPAYHRLDVGVSGSYPYRGWQIEPELQIVNLYNRKNVYIRTYDMTKNPATYKDITMLPLLPTLGVTVRF